MENDLTSPRRPNRTMVAVGAGVSSTVPLTTGQALEDVGRRPPDDRPLRRPIKGRHLVAHVEPWEVSSLYDERC